MGAPFGHSSQQSAHAGHPESSGHGGFSQVSQRIFIGVFPLFSVQSTPSQFDFDLCLPDSCRLASPRAQVFAETSYKKTVTVEPKINTE